MRRLTLMITLSASFAAPAAGDVEYFFDFDQWAAEAGSVTTIDFVEAPSGTIGTFYEDLGAVFPEPDDFKVADTEYHDGAGAYGGLWLDQITIELDGPRTSFAVLQPGGMQIDLYRGHEIVFDEVETFGDDFLGLTSDVWFDRVVVTDPAGFTFVDDVYFGPIVPAPASTVVLALGSVGIGGLGGRRRR